MKIIREKASALLLVVVYCCSAFIAVSSPFAVAETVNTFSDDTILQNGEPKTDSASKTDETAAETVTRSIPHEYQVVAEQKDFRLYTDPKSGRFVVESKKSNRTWWSVPNNITEDTIAKGKNKMNQQSLILLKYGDPESNTLDTVGSQAGSVQKKSYELKKINNGFRITYDFTSVQIKVPVEVVLKDSHLSVTVPTADISEYGQNYIYELQLLPSMGAGFQTDHGWLFVPDGSGAIINFNNGKQMLSQYSEMVYGKDANASIIQQIEVKESIRIPVYGAKNGQQAFLGVISENDGIAWLDASVSGKTSSFNTVSSRFSLRNTDTYVMGKSTGNSRTVVLYSTAPLTKTPIQVQFYFLEDENASLSGMAKAYKQYLTLSGMKGIEKGNMQPPVYIDVLGAVYKEMPVMGIPVTSVIPVTDFKACGVMLDYFSEKGLNQLIVKYSNWSSDLIRGKVSDSAVADRKLGGNSGLKRLLADHSPGQIYLDSDFTYVSKWQFGYGKNGYASKSISNIPTIKFEHDIATFFSDGRFPQKWLLSPWKITQISKKYLILFKKHKNPFISMGNTASVLYSDFSKQSNTRDDSKSVLASLYKNYKKEGQTIMVSSGNSFTAVYADHILDAPVCSSNFDVIDESVPFYQMVFHGSKMIGSEAINIAADPKKALLRAVQGGAMLHYSFINAENHKYLDGTVYDCLYSADYKVWSGRVLEQYQSLKPLYEKIMYSGIIQFDTLASDVSRTVYDDGTEVVVNFSNKSFNYHGEVIEAFGYRYWLGQEG